MESRMHNIKAAIRAALNTLLKYGVGTLNNNWQGMNVKGTPLEEMVKITNYTLECINVPDTIEELRLLVEPDLPWADIHFDERVSGIPHNPGESYKQWKFFRNSPGADEQFRKEGGKFSHTYMERYWPKFIKAYSNHQQGSQMNMGQGETMGIRYNYGDLKDVINLFLKDPITRQGYIPVWFPEDTGAVNGQRVPCTLGYLFFLENGQLYCNYYIRSCDAFKHFRNDIYLTIRLQHWILFQLRQYKPEFWNRIKPGPLTMFIANFHVFRKELNFIRDEIK